LRKVGRVAGGVYVHLTIEQGLGEVGDLLGAGAAVAASAGQVALVAAANVHQLQSNGGEGSLLARLAATGGVLLDDSLELLLEVAHNILPDLHVLDGGLKTGVIKRGRGTSISTRF